MRLFFGMEIHCPWPEEFPKGRTLLAKDRHLTLAFLGDTVDMPALQIFPKPPFSIGLCGIFDRPLFLAHVIAWHAHFLENGLHEYQKELSKWLNLKESFLLHVTMARKPFDKGEWKKTFESLPFYVKDINLYESLGHSKYKILWHYPILAPFDEIEHTADLAFRIRRDHFLHAQVALAFHYPPMIRYFDHQKIERLEEIVAALNRMIAKADSEIGCPFKAVSFHGTQETSDEWEMIVDV